MNSLKTSLLAAVVLAASAGSGFAVPVTIDFTSGTGDNLYIYTEDGFRFRPESGDHFENNWTNDGRFSWHDGPANNPPNIITLDRADNSGNPFTALSVTVTELATNSGNPGGIRFEDSNGNFVNALSLGSVVLNFSNTAWVKFRIINSGVNSFPISIDNFNLDTNPNVLGVPDAGSSLVLVGAGVLALAFWRRRLRS